MTEREHALKEELTKFSKDEFNYIDTKDITRADDIDYGCSGVYIEGTIVYLEIKNISYILKESGSRKAAQAYTMLHTVITCLLKDYNGAFLNCFSPNAFLIVYPGKEESNK